MILIKHGKVEVSFTEISKLSSQTVESPGGGKFHHTHLLSDRLRIPQHNR